MRAQGIRGFVVGLLLGGTMTSLALAEGVAWREGDASAVGLRPLSGADGVTEVVTRGGVCCLADKENTEPRSMYLYFDIDDARALDMTGPVYVLVEYFDTSMSGQVLLEYDSGNGDEHLARYQPSDDQWGGWLAGENKWKTAAFLLAKPRLRNGQNLGADLRLGGGPLLIRSVRIEREAPAGLDRLGAVPKSVFKRKVKIGQGGQLIVGGFDPARLGDARRQARTLEAALPAMKSMGVTSHECYVRWNLCEPAPGRYDWSVYDAFVDLYKKYNMKWVPFLIIGSAYSLPDWYYKQPGSQGYVCLEHGETCDVDSLWNPVLREHVARFIRAFCDRYRDTGVIESILLGVTGNYGEAIYVATGNDWTADIHGPYHTHPGFWAGDPYAVADFQKWAARKYATPAALDAAWGTSFAEFAAVRPFLRDQAPNDRAWLDFCAWYIGSMTDWSRFWLEETRKNFPKGGIYLCTGGHAPAEHGANFGDQCKIAAAVQGGVRITNEGSDYRANFSLTRWVASAGRQYGAYFSFEPAGEVNPAGVVGRIYNASLSGALGLHYYYPNLFGLEAASKNFIRWGKEFKQRKPVVEIAVYYPQTYIKLKGNEFLGKVQPLRDCFDFDYMSDEQILDGGLDNTKALILLWGNVSEANVWDAIAHWVDDGGLLCCPGDLGTLRTVEGDETIHDRILGPAAAARKGRVVKFDGKADGREYRAFLANEFATARELSRATRTMVAADGKEDNVYVALCRPQQLFWLNYTPKPATKNGKKLPPYSIVAQPCRMDFGF